MKLKNKAFTLIELLAVIIILAIVALIATPIILDVIEDSRDSANLSEVNLILGGAETYYAQSFLTGDSKQFDGVTNLYSNIKTTHEKPPLGNLTIRNDGKISLSIYNEGVCYTKGYDESKVQVDKTITSLDDCVPLSIVVYTDKNDNNNWYKENLTATIETNGERFEYCIKDETDVCTNIEVTATTTTIDLTQGFNEICATGYRGENTSNTCVEFNIDTVVPTLTAKTNNVITIGVSINTSSFYEEPVYGISGGSVSCNPSNTSNITTTTTVTCTATSNAGLSSENVETSIAIADTPATPELNEALIAVNIAPNGTVTKANTTDGTWYAYHNKEWANAILITDDTNRLMYQNAEVGTVINQAHIASYYVWIPRYEYQLFDLDVAVDTGEEQSINIDFVTKDDPKKTTAELGQYYTHPAFTIFDGTTTTEINGFWIGKFEVSGTTENLKIIPNVSPLRSISVSNFYYSIKNLNGKYGISDDLTVIDSHMTKNMEWGAVAYLSHSNFGLDGMITTNHAGFITGCGGRNDSNVGSSSCINAYGTIGNNVYGQSTTGNISGVFDMSGGAREYVMGSELDENGNFNNEHAGFTTPINIKYYDLYNQGDIENYSLGKIGDATRETTKWYADSAQMPVWWVVRGGGYSSQYDAGIFSFTYSLGSAHSHYSARATLWVY